MQAPEHWLPIRVGWHLWTDLELRGAGFSSAWLPKLGDAESARCAAAWLTAEADERAEGARAVTALEHALAGANRGGKTPALRAALAVTTAFALPGARSGMRGRSRIYGEPHTLAYAHLYLPLRRLFSIRLWSLF